MRYLEGGPRGGERKRAPIIRTGTVVVRVDVGEAVALGDGILGDTTWDLIVQRDRPLGYKWHELTLIATNIITNIISLLLISIIPRHPKCY